MKRILNRLLRMETGINALQEHSDYEKILGGLTALEPIVSFPITEMKAFESKESAELGTLLTKYGSDKATTHDYHHVYANILKTPSTLLEIGLGTNDVRIPSNMGADGRPGASVRAFRDFLPESQIYGADIDEECLFEEERIKTYPVDQLSSDSLNKLGEEINTKMDFVIDD